MMSEPSNRDKIDAVRRLLGTTKAEVFVWGVGTKPSTVHWADILEKAGELLEIDYWLQHTPEIWEFEALGEIPEGTVTLNLSNGMVKARVSVRDPANSPDLPVIRRILARIVSGEELASNAENGSLLDNQSSRAPLHVVERRACGFIWKRLTVASTKSSTLLSEHLNFPKSYAANGLRLTTQQDVASLKSRV